ncbi:TonB-dependent receptor domain-containing protein [Acinetobacter johnsonii]|uniref:TonB-dependent receptor domain-containing protein n=1 Tax=Acinetobacter johnsonii TaxID=40214 RepID=UPI0021676053|nr:TonB-dependent receptor [Acinetobacter johnsonii]MCS3526456.1 outer membrane receptor for ferrienterochelin and colicins [Acinetobacter johnsonii]
MGKNLTRSTLALAVVGAMSSFAMANETVTTGAEKDTTQLQTIVVSATGYEQDVSKAPASITVISREELDKREYNDITDVLRSVPGVVITGENASQTVSIRGMSSNYTLFLVDGKRQYSKDVNPNGDDYGMEKNILPPVASIERIEIIRGPASTLYGSDAMGGVINIITKKVTDVWTGNVELGTTIQDKNNSGDIRNGSVYLAGPIIQDKVGLQLGLNRLERKEDSYLGGFTGHTTESLNSRLTYVLNDQHDLAVEANFFTQESEATAGKTVAATGTDSASRNIRSVYALTHNGRYTDNLDSKSYIQYENSKNPDRENTVVGTKGIDLETWTANTQWNWLLGNHTLAFGGYYKDESLLDRATNRNPLVPEFDELTRWSAAAFLEDTWSLTDRFNLTLGARYDHDELYQGNISPRVYGVYNFTDQFTVKGGVSTGYKQPDIRSVTDGFYSVTGGSGSPTTTGRGIIKANPDLEPESTVTSELGFYWNNDYVNTSITGYLTQFKDRIEEIRECDSTGNADYNRNDVSTWKCSENGIPFAFISTRENIGKAELRGVEVTFDAKLAEYTTLTANYTFTDTEIKSGQFKGQPLNGMPEHVFNVTVDHDLTDALNIWSRLHVRGETTPYLGRSSMSDPIPGYNFLDVGFNYKFAPNLKGKFGVYNVLDETAQNADGEQTLDGRRYGVSFVANF